MSRHSKNCTSNPIFTYAERRRLKYGTISQRLGNDSMKEYDCCALCMGKLIDPLCWYVNKEIIKYYILFPTNFLIVTAQLIYPSSSKGHIFCKECIYEYLLAQKKEIVKQNELFEEQQKRIQEDQALQEVERKQKEIELFDKTVLGLGKVVAPKRNF